MENNEVVVIKDEAQRCKELLVSGMLPNVKAFEGSPLASILKNHRDFKYEIDSCNFSFGENYPTITKNYVFTLCEKSA